jgi:hypothetical protein
MKQKIYFKQNVLVIFQIIKEKSYYKNDDIFHQSIRHLASEIYVI